MHQVVGQPFGHGVHRLGDDVLQLVASQGSAAGQVDHMRCRQVVHRDAHDAVQGSPGRCQYIVCQLDRGQPLPHADGRVIEPDVQASHLLDGLLGSMKRVPQRLRVGGPSIAADEGAPRRVVVHRHQPSALMPDESQHVRHVVAHELTAGVHSTAERVVGGIALAAHPVERLHHNHAMTALLQPSCGHQAGEASADHDDIGSHLVREIRGRHQAVKPASPPAASPPPPPPP